MSKRASGLDIRAFFKAKQPCSTSPTEQELSAELNERQELVMNSEEEHDLTDKPELELELVENEEHMQPQAEAESVQQQSTDEVQEQPATQTEGIQLEHPLDCPYQPSAKDIEPLTMANRTFRFQDSWYEAFPWLHYSNQLKGALCIHCMKTFAQKTSTLAKSAEQTFISLGFRNWRKGREAFSHHECSKAHGIAVTTHTHLHNSVRNQLCTPSASAQEAARSALLQIVGAVRYLSKQGLAFRGHSAEEGNFQTYLRDKAEDDPNLAGWLQKNHSYTSPDVQNEILSIMGNTIIRGIVGEISALPVLQYSIIMDGTQDISGTEQISICLRYVDKDLEPREEFVGMYEASSTTAEHLWKIASDVLLRLDLPLSGLRGQTYDGAANMSGHLSGMQALVRRVQPLATFIHCGPHCVNLVTQAVSSSAPVVNDALHWIHDLGCLFGQSGKFKTIFKQIAISENGSVTTIKPLCATRWTVRTPAIKSVLAQYELVMAALEEMAAVKGSVSAPRARGLLDHFNKGTTILGLVLGQEIFLKLEGLNRSLQGRAVTIGGMLKAVECTKKALVAGRTDDAFMSLYSRAVELTTSFDLESIKLPHVRKASNRYGGPAKSHIPSSVEEYFRVQFFCASDTAVTQLDDRFHQEGLGYLAKLEEHLLTGKCHEAVARYPELDAELLQVQLAMMKASYQFTSCQEASQLLTTMVPEVRRLFNQVETLIRLLLVVPASSCEAERSFSALRRLKTWLRSTMTQCRLNGVSVCHVHREKLQAINREQIAVAFIGMSERRSHVFGAF
ncbi:Zinc finger MYM-type protein 1 [Merluccius polli]|uniref:Zinc finger MYM-type protein 1 n=1 Tax=Merluccius polli TaxID=89951 RepID=A0AA47MQF6_MERPO|nr:Zinc finger MYM-type protein 1 [Merluccius polli]